jgi:flagellar motor switch protein FliN
MNVTETGQAGNVSRAELAELDDSRQEPGASWARRNFELVKNLKVPVSAVLGSCEITVDQLYALKEGSTVSLEQPVDATVDVTVEGKVIARGEIVVVGDNFGVRIVELLATGPEAE